MRRRLLIVPVAKLKHVTPTTRTTRFGFALSVSGLFGSLARNVPLKVVYLRLKMK